MLWLRVYSASQGLDSAGGVVGGTLFTASILLSTKLLPFHSARSRRDSSKDTGRRRGGFNRASQLYGKAAELKKKYPPGDLNNLVGSRWAGLNKEVNYRFALVSLWIVGFLVGANSPNRNPIISSVILTGRNRFPLWTWKVRPTNWGKMTERRDHILVGIFSDRPTVPSVSPRPFNVRPSAPMKVSSFGPTGEGWSTCSESSSE